MRQGSLRQRFYGVVFAAVVVSALAALSDAVAGVDGGDAPDAAAPAGVRPDASVVPDARISPDGGMRPDVKRPWRAGRRGANVDGGVARDGGLSARFKLPPIVGRMTPPPAPAPAPAVPSGPAPSSPPSDIPFNTCQKVPAGKRVVRLTLKPDTELPTLVAWISSITCKPFVLPSHLGAAGKKVTIVAPSVMTREEAYAAFLNALDAIGLAVERAPGYLKIIESAKAKSASVPVYDFNGRATR